MVTPEHAHQVIETYWLAARNRADDACLPAAWLIEFVPGVFWGALAMAVTAAAGALFGAAA